MESRQKRSAHFTRPNCSFESRRPAVLRVARPHRTGVAQAVDVALALDDRKRT